MDRQELIDRLNGNYPEYTKKSATKQKKVQHEGQLQIACVRWFRLQYPAYASLLFHPKNEADGATSGKKIAINAASGVVPGVPDLILALPSITEENIGDLSPHKAFYHALGIELKYGHTNQQSAHQKEFQAFWEAAGYKYVLCRSLEEVMQQVDDYMQHVPLSAKQSVSMIYHSDPDTEANKKLFNKIIKSKK